MKGKIKVLVLFALFVSVVIGAVAFGGVRSNALLVRPNKTDAEYLDNYYNNYVKAEHFFAGQAPNSNDRKWYNYANPTYEGADIVQDTKTYFDYDGLHFNNIPSSENGTHTSPVTFNHTQIKDNFTFGNAGMGYTIQFYLGEFHHVYKPRNSGNTANQDYFFQITGKNIVFTDNWGGPYTENAELAIYYEVDNNNQGYLCVYYPRAFYDGSGASQAHIKYKISESELSDSLITLVLYFDTTYTTARDITGNNRWIKLYVDKQKVGHNGMGGNSGVPNSFSEVSNICVGSNDHYLRTSELIMRSLRFYNFALTDAQIEQNYNVDAALYKGTGPIADEAAPVSKTAPYYGITGFDKIVKQSKLGEKAGALTESSTNELFEDWEAPNWSMSQSELNKYQRYAESWSGWAPKGDKEARSTFIDIGSSKNNTSINSKTSHSSIDGYIGSPINHKYDTNPNSNKDAAIFIENSFFVRSKYKCGIYDESHSFDANKIGTEESPKLMATCDIYPRVLADFDFCGMVVDYSDDIYKKYNPEMNYFGQIWDGKTRTEEPMYTEFEKLEKDSQNEGFTQTSLFPTGVGFNIVRIRDEYVQWKDLMNDDDETRQTNHKDVRIFVGGTHMSSKRATTYLDLDIDVDSSLHNFTIYRTCEQWPYNKTGNIDKGDNVYLYKFYMDKKLIAVVGMEIDADNGGICKSQEGVICKIDNNGNISKSVTTGVATIRDWSVHNNYGPNGAHKDDTNNDGTPSGNILIAFHKVSATLDNDPGTIFYDKTSSDTIMCTEDNMGMIILDNIGYMDYHNQKLTQNTYNGSYTVNQDMTFTLKSSLIFSRLVFEPDIYFNRLGYNRSLEKYSDMGKTAYNAALSDPDFKASHGKAKLSSMAENAQGIVMRYNGVDGVYFKDIADLITYDLVDFNGETMFTKELKAIDYFTKLYKLNKGTDAEKQELLDAMELTEVPQALILSDNQINLMLDLIELGKAHSDYAKYWKLAGQFEGQTIGTLEDFAVISGNVPDFDTSDDIGSAYAKSLIDAKPAKISTGNNKESQAFFKSFALSIKSYVSLLVKVQVPNGWTSSMKDHMKVYYAGENGTKGAAYNLVYYSADDINAYHDGEVFKHGAVTTVEPIEGTSSSYVTIEIKLSLSDFDKQFYFELIDGATTTSTYVYGLYDYCLSKWDNSDRTLREFARRAFHIGELAQYYDGTKGTFELWKNHQ